MTTTPTTQHVQRVTEFVRRFGYEGQIKPEEARAIDRVEIIHKLGFPVTVSVIERELKITRETNARMVVT